ERRAWSTSRANISPTQAQVAWISRCSNRSRIRRMVSDARSSLRPHASPPSRAPQASSRSRDTTSAPPERSASVVMGSTQQRQRPGSAQPVTNDDALELPRPPALGHRGQVFLGDLGRLVLLTLVDQLGPWQLADAGRKV